MWCPECLNDIKCGCKACVRRNGSEGAMRYVFDGEAGECPHCGLTKHLDEWMNVEAEQVDFYLYEERIEKDGKTDLN